ncbi:MAG: imidazole glycerol phosphate synthase subunit HisH [Candidatus Omnitrophica bacterium]|nr:imidazole glycerol phosphate synthase subunit HisH [Candidatus Omnitrophota bacterium]
MIAIIDYGMGNIHSVAKALEAVGAEVLVTNKAQEIKNADKLVLPGVGAFGDAMQELEKQKLVKVIKEEIKRKKIFLGICLGMHLLFERSEESPKIKGLGLLKGGVVRFPVKKELKVPHMGWNQVSPVNECPLLKGVENGAFVYFCHSYYPVPQDKDVSAAVTDYGLNFSSVVWKGNIFGAQFHPEKSQSVGLKIIKNFVEM